MTASDRRRRVVLPIAVTILGLAAIGVVEDIPVRHSIEQKLTKASNTALANAGVTVQGVSFTGRDGTVRVDSAAVGNQALAIVSHVNGVRVVRVVLTTGSPLTAAPIPTPTTTPYVTLTLTVIPSGSPSDASSPSAAPEPSASPVPLPSPSASPSMPATPTPTPTPSSTGSSGSSVAAVQSQLNTLGKIKFAPGSYTLDGADLQIVAHVAAVLKANPTVAIRIEGNTDSIGSASSNLRLSRNRAQAVANALRALGVAPGRMTVIAYGETKPLVPNDTAAHREINRRVDFVAAGI